MAPKTQTSLLLAGVALLAFFLGWLLAPGRPAAEPATPGPAPAAATIWTCSMHPQIHQSEPGQCPICGMDLIPLVDETDSGPRTLSMSESARALAEIETTTVERRFPEVPVRLVGKIEYDETRVRSLAARFPARIEELYVNYTGIRVDRGEHLAEVYSPELLAAQRELLTAHRSSPDSAISTAAAEKLRLWDLLPDQIEAILARGEPSDRFELRAPTGGVVVTKNVKEGDYVKTGEPLFRIADLSQLWLILDAFESDLARLRYGQTVEFTVEAYPGETFTGTIAFIEPELDRRTRTVRVRVNVANADLRLKPGMFARGTVFVRMAAHGEVFAPELAGKWISPMHPEIVKDGPGTCDICGMDLVPAESLGYASDETLEAPLVIPRSAVLLTGRRAVVYVRRPGTERPTYEGREVVLGPRAGDVFIVVSGLEAGEAVVTHGAFKIDSALQIQAKPSMMSATDPAPPTAVKPALEVPADRLGDLLPPYFALQKALADDDLAGAQEALRALMAVTGHHGDLPALLHEMLAAPDLAGIRRPHFDTLSEAFIAAVSSHPGQLDGAVFRMHCPMVYPDRGADWLQPERELRNPFFGAAMLRCGELTDSWNDASTTREP